MIDPILPPFSAKGDGITNDGALLAAALACGDDLYLPRGRTFVIDSVTLLPRPGQRIFGGGRLRKAISIPGYTNSFIRVLGVDGVTIDGIEFECTNNAREYGVTIESAKHTTIKNCRFVARCTPVFIWRLSQYTRICDNFMTGGQQGIATGGDAAGNTNGLILDTWIERNEIVGNDEEGIDINWDTQRCWITNNTIRGNALADSITEIDCGGGQTSEIYFDSNTIDGLGHTASGLQLKLGASHIRFQGAIHGCQYGLNFWPGGSDYVTATDSDLSGNSIMAVSGLTNLGSHCNVGSNIT